MLSFGSQLSSAQCHYARQQKPRFPKLLTVPTSYEVGFSASHFVTVGGNDEEDRVGILDGFWAWIEHDTNADRTEFRVQWVSSDMEHSVPQVLHLLPGKTLKDCVMDTMHTTMEHLDLDIKPQDSGVENARIILSAIQLVLYLLSENAEIDWVPKPVRHQHISGNLSKLETVEDKASTVDESLVGVRIGAALKKAHYIHASSGFAGSGHTKRSHTRRGHWHHYWTGSTNGNRMLVLKWTAPTVIHPESGADDSNVVVFPVKK